MQKVYRIHSNKYNKVGTFWQTLPNAFEKVRQIMEAKSEAELYSLSLTIFKERETIQVQEAFFDEKTVSIGPVISDIPITEFYENAKKLQIEPIAEPKEGNTIYKVHVVKGWESLQIEKVNEYCFYLSNGQIVKKDEKTAFLFFGESDLILLRIATSTEEVYSQMIGRKLRTTEDTNGSLLGEGFDEDIKQIIGKAIYYQSIGGRKIRKTEKPNLDSLIQEIKSENPPTE